MSTTIYLVRTGETAWDVEGRVRGRVDVPLTEAGQAASKATAQALAEFDTAAIYCAPGEPARATARILAKTLGGRPRRLDETADINFGLWQGMCWADVEKRHPKAYRRLVEEPLSVTPPEGEALREVLRRVRAALARLAGKHPEQSIVLVCSAEVCGFVRTCVEGGRIEAPSARNADDSQWWTVEMAVAIQDA